MFWKKDKNTLPGPRGVPDTVGRDIVSKLGGDPDQVWKNLKAVIRPKEGTNNAFEVRVFSPDEAFARNVSVKDYNSLNGHPELILYEGWYNKDAQAEIIKRQ